jgi:uncharacterized protein
MDRVEELLASKFVCRHCKSRGAHPEKVALSGTGLTAFMDLQPHRYLFLSCHNCGSTEVFNLKTLEGQDNLSDFLDTLFAL